MDAVVYPLLFQGVRKRHTPSVQSFGGITKFWSKRRECARTKWCHLEKRRYKDSITSSIIKEFPSVQLTLLVATQHRCYYTPCCLAHILVGLWRGSHTSLCCGRTVGFQGGRCCRSAGSWRRREQREIFSFTKWGISYTQNTASWPLFTCSFGSRIFGAWSHLGGSVNCRLFGTVC